MNFSASVRLLTVKTNGLTRWFLKAIQHGFLVFIALTMICCSEEESTDQFPFIILKQGSEYTPDGARVPVGGQMKFGISAVGGGSAITNIRVKRILPGGNYRRT